MTNISQFTQTAITAATCGLVGVSAGCNAYYGYSLTPVVFVAAGFAVAGASAEVLKSRAIIFIAECWRRENLVGALGGTLLAAVAVAYSFAAGLGLSAETRSVKTGDRSNAIVAFQDAQTDKRRLDATLAQMRANSRWSSTKGCTDATVQKSKDFCVTYQKAERSAKAKARVIAGGRPQSADPQADAIAAFLSLFTPVSTENVGRYMPYLLPLLLEIGTLFGFSLARRFEDEQPEPERVLAEPVQVFSGHPARVQACSAVRPRRVRSAPVRQSTEQSAFAEHVRGLIKNGEHVRTTQRALANDTGAGLGSVSQWLKDMAAAGQIQLQTTSRGTIISAA